MKYIYLILCVSSVLFSDERTCMTDRINDVENSLLQAISIEGQPLQKKNILTAMKEHGTPAVSIAVINNGQVEWAKAYGVLEANGLQPVDTQTLFQAGSISKPVAAVGVFSLLQKGILHLDQDVNQLLHSWKIPENEYTQAQQVTLRHLLSHTSGFNVIGFDGYYAHDKVPTLLQILEGANPANSPPLHVEFLPGSKLAYSGGGYSVMQQLVEDVIKGSFTDFMQEECFQKLGLTRSTFHYPLDDTNAAHSHAGESNGRPMNGRWKTYPESAAAGLWTTATELALLLVDLQKSYHGFSDAKILQKQAVHTMFEPQIAPWALGPVVTGSDEKLEVSHYGRTDGTVASFVSFPALQKGAVVMINSDNGSILIDEIMRSIAHVYNWPTYRAQTKKALFVTASDLVQYVGRYGTEKEPNDIYDLTVGQKDDALFIQYGKVNPFRIYPESKHRFFVIENGHSITFNENQHAQGIQELVVGLPSGYSRTFTRFLP